MVKRFHLFTGARYYPGGGMWDYRGAFDTLDAAKKVVADDEWCDWANIAQISGDDLVWTLQFDGTWREVPACSGCGLRSLNHDFDRHGNLVCDDCDPEE